MSGDRRNRADRYGGPGHSKPPRHWHWMVCRACNKVIHPYRREEHDECFKVTHFSPSDKDKPA